MGGKRVEANLCVEALVLEREHEDTSNASCQRAPARLYFVVQFSQALTHARLELNNLNKTGPIFIFCWYLGVRLNIINIILETLGQVQMHEKKVDERGSCQGCPR